jgi:hypothetical protein
MDRNRIHSWAPDRPVAGERVYLAAFWVVLGVILMLATGCGAHQRLHLTDRSIHRAQERAAVARQQASQRSFEEFQANHPETAPDVLEAIREGRLLVGMTVPEVRAAIPDLTGDRFRYRRYAHVQAGVQSETWVIAGGNGFLYFTEGVLTGWFRQQ